MVSEPPVKQTSVCGACLAMYVLETYKLHHVVGTLLQTAYITTQRCYFC